MILVELERNGYTCIYEEGKRLKISKNRREILEIEIVCNNKKIIIKTKEFKIYCRYATITIKSGLYGPRIAIKLSNAKIRFNKSNGRWHKWNHKVPFFPELPEPMSMLIK